MFWICHLLDSYYILWCLHWSWKISCLLFSCFDRLLSFPPLVKLCFSKQKYYCLSAPQTSTLHTSDHCSSFLSALPHFTILPLRWEKLQRHWRWNFMYNYRMAIFSPLPSVLSWMMSYILSPSVQFPFWEP